MGFRVQGSGVWDIGFRVLEYGVCGMRSRVVCVCVCVCVCDLAWLKKHLEGQEYAGFKCAMRKILHG